VLSNFNRCKNGILEIDLLSRTIYKPPCSPSAAPCGPWESGCNLVASIASFVCVISKQRSEFLTFGRTVQDEGSRGRTVLSQEASGSFGAAKKATDTKFFEVCR